MLYRFLWSQHPSSSAEDTNGFSILSMSPGGEMSPQSLPSGLMEHNYTVYLKVQVRDSLGVTAWNDLKTQVSGCCHRTPYLLK